MKKLDASKTPSSDSLTTVIGSTAAIVGLGAALIASAAPVAAIIVAGGGAVVAAGALYKKLSGHPARATKNSQ
jgi:hypothetical protein